MRSPHFVPVAHRAGHDARAIAVYALVHEDLGVGPAKVLEHREALSQLHTSDATALV